MSTGSRPTPPTPAGTATDVSTQAVAQLLRDADKERLTQRVETYVHDIRRPLPLLDAAVDAVYAHMLLCMAWSTAQIRALVSEVHRVLRAFEEGELPRRLWRVTQRRPAWLSQQGCLVRGGQVTSRRGTFRRQLPAFDVVTFFRSTTKTSEELAGIEPLACVP